MSDPLSIAASCVGLITAAGATAGAIVSFVWDCCEARADLTTISRELVNLRIILELLKSDEEGGSLPGPLQGQIISIVDSCGGLISNIDDLLKRHKRKTGAVRWAIDGKREAESLRRGLEEYRSSLSLAVETVTLFLTKSIKNDTEAIRDHTQDIPNIKYDTERILYEIKDLRISLKPGADKAWSTGGVLIENYLDQLSSYEETVCEEVVGATEAEHEP